MKKTFLFLVFAIAFNLNGNTLHAQLFGPKKKDIEAVKHRKLIVVLEHIDIATSQKLSRKDPKFLAGYEAAVDSYNVDMKEIMAKFWKWHKPEDILFKTWKEVNALYENNKNSKKYAVLSCYSMTPHIFMSGFSVVKGVEYYEGVENDVTKNSGWTTQMSIRLLEDWKGMFATPIIQIDLPFIFPKKPELFYGINAIATYLDARLDGKDKGDMKDEMKENQVRLKTKTLALLDQWVPEKMTDEDIAKAYPYKFKVVKYQELERIILEQDEQYAYVMVVPHIISNSRMNRIVYFHLVIDAKEFIPLGMHTPNVLAFALTGGITGTGKSMITEKTLKDYIEYLK